MTLDLSLPWTSYAITVCDVETTGLDPDADRVCEVAAVRFVPLFPGARATGWKIDRTRVSPINPGCPIPPECTEIHGVTDEIAAGSPKFAEVWPDVLAMYEAPEGTAGVLTCAYAALFDRGFLTREHKRNGFTSEQAPIGMRGRWLDPLPPVQRIDRFVKGPKRHRLLETSKRWGLPFDGAHRAEDDAIAAGQILTSEKMARELVGLSRRLRLPLTAAGLLDIVEACRAEAKADHGRFQTKQAPDRGKATTCKSCGASIVWIETDAGKPMPLDAEPSPTGTVMLDETGRRGSVCKGDDLERCRTEGVPLRVSHFATCAQASQHRRPSRGA